VQRGMVEVAQVAAEPHERPVVAADVGIRRQGAGAC
jgi:hypothetical protein